MKQGTNENLKPPRKEKTVGYILAALVALQPLLDTSVDFSKPEAVLKYSIKLIVAVAVAVLGKYAANRIQVMHKANKQHH